MRKSELFDAYLSDSLSPEQAEELKKVLATENGSKEFMRYMTESHLMCEILEKQDDIQKVEPPAKKTNIIPFIFAAAAALLAIIFLVKAPGSTDSEITITEKEREKETPVTAVKIYQSKDIKNLVLEDGTSIQSEGNGQLTVVDKNNVKIEQGFFSFQVKPRPKQPPFRIQMSNGIIEVIGTAFDIVDSPEKSSIKVTEGTVKFIRNDDEIILKAGDSASADRENLVKTKTDLSEKLELFIDGEYTDDKRAFRDISAKKRTGWASWQPGDEGAVKQEIDNNNPAIAFTKTGRLGIDKFILNGPFTLSVWTKPNGMKKSFQTMLSNGNSSWRLSLNDETFNAHFAISGMSPEFVNSKRALVPNQWTLVTAVYDGSKLKLFINGVLDSEQNVQGTIQQYKGNIEVAGNSEEWARNFEGSIDGVQVFSRSLSDLEILSLFQQGRP